MCSKIKDECLHLTFPTTKIKRNLWYTFSCTREHILHLGLIIRTIYQVTGRTLSFELGPKQQRVMKPVLAAVYTDQRSGSYSLEISMVLEY